MKLYLLEGPYVTILYLSARYFTKKYLQEAIRTTFTSIRSVKKFTSNKERLKHVNELDVILSEWVSKRNLTDVVDTLNKSGAVVGPMYDVKQIYSDTHYKFRESL